MTDRLVRLADVMAIVDGCLERAGAIYEGRGRIMGAFSFGAMAEMAFIRQEILKLQAPLELEDGMTIDVEIEKEATLMLEEGIEKAPIAEGSLKDKG